MSDQTSLTRTAEAASAKASESARRAARFVSEKVAQHGGDAADRASRTGRRMANSVSKKVAHHGGNAAGLASRESRRVALSVSEKLRAGASKRGIAALAKLTDAGIKLTGKQQEALERLKSRVSE